ncbi:MAG: hypothetical protein JWQ74_2028 [Marmoricola sp.]|nr:hypothetical protein [Marmoricola sp.]
MLACWSEPGTGYPVVVTDHQPRSQAQKTRSVVRRAAAALAVALVGLVMLPVSAMADTPSGWEDAPHVSGLQFLVVLVLIPAGLFAVIALLAALPSLISDKGYEPGQSWRSDAEWFGGPRKGIEAADDASPQQIEAAESERGGVSGKW